MIVAIPSTRPMTFAEKLKLNLRLAPEDEIVANDSDIRLPISLHSSYTTLDQYFPPFQVGSTSATYDHNVR